MVKRLSFGIAVASFIVTVVMAWIVAPRGKTSPPPVAHVAEAAQVVQATHEDSRTHEMNEYWLGRINALRGEHHLHPLMLSTMLMANATEWATWMGTNATLTHDRPDGSVIHTRTYVENIGRAYADETTESLHAAMDQVLGFMLDEDENGPHRRTIFRPDWDSVGAGFYFEPVSPGRVRVYMAFHYASFATSSSAFLQARPTETR